MKIDFLNFYLFSVPVDFDLAWIKILFSNHLIIELGCKGYKGVGEGVLYKTSPFKTLDLLKGKIESFFNEEFLSLGSAKRAFFKNFSSSPGIVCAFDTALWDLEGKLENKSVNQLIGKKKRNSIPVSEQIFLPKNKKNLTEQTKKILNHKTHLIKFKAGRNLNKDLENIKTIKKVSQGKINIQLDLNQGLNFNRAIYFGRKVEELGVSAWEEPINFKSFIQLNRLKRKIKIPIILDESIKNTEDLKKAIKNRAIDILNVKINRLGGLTNSIQLIKLCGREGIKIDIGCNEELGIGTMSQLHLATILKDFRIMEALGPQRLGFDLIKEKFKIENGCLKKSLSKAGLGVEFESQQLKKAGEKFGFAVIGKEDNFKDYSSFYFDYLKKRMKSKCLNGVLFLNKKLTNYV